MDLLGFAIPVDVGILEGKKAVVFTRPGFPSLIQDFLELRGTLGCRATCWEDVESFSEPSKWEPKKKKGGSHV